MMSTLEEIYTQRFTEILLPLTRRLEEHLRECLDGEVRIDRIAVRAKSVERFIEKASKTVAGRPKYGNPLKEIQDQIGARIVTYYTSDVDRIAACVDMYFRHIESKEIVPDSESEFGYIGRHYIMLLPADILDDKLRAQAPSFFELQIKTLFQHAWAEANHDLGYKPERELTPDDKRRLAFTAAQAWGADMIFNELFARKETEGKGPTNRITIRQY
jgi:putative GTP pyrophosphokinase